MREADLAYKFKFGINVENIMGSSSSFPNCRSRFGKWMQTCTTKEREQKCNAKEVSRFEVSNENTGSNLAFSENKLSEQMRQVNLLKNELVDCQHKVLQREEDIQKALKREKMYQEKIHHLSSLESQNLDLLEKYSILEEDYHQMSLVKSEDMMQHYSETLNVKEQMIARLQEELASLKLELNMKISNLEHTLNVTKQEAALLKYIMNDEQQQLKSEKQELTEEIQKKSNDVCRSRTDLTAKLSIQITEQSKQIEQLENMIIDQEQDILILQMKLELMNCKTQLDKNPICSNSQVSTGQQPSSNLDLLHDILKTNLYRENNFLYQT